MTGISRETSSQTGEAFPIYSLHVPRSLRHLQTLWWSQLSQFFLTGPCQPSRPSQAAPPIVTAFQLGVTLAYLPFQRANRSAYNRLDQPSHCTFTAEVTLAFHVPAFQRNHSKRLAPFTLERSGSNSRRTRLTFGHPHDAEQVPDPGVCGLRSPTRPFRRIDRDSRHSHEKRSHSMALTLLCKLIVPYATLRSWPHGHPEGPSCSRNSIERSSFLKLYFPFYFVIHHCE